MAYEFAFGTGISHQTHDENKPIKLLDLCAGFGILSFALKEYCGNNIEITCVEYNPKFIEIGKKLLPEANWIQGSIGDDDLIDELKTMKFDYVISNPPLWNNTIYEGC